MRCGNRGKLAGEFAQENKALRPEKHDPWQKFTETAETYRDPTP